MLLFWLSILTCSKKYFRNFLFFLNCIEHLFSSRVYNMYSFISKTKYQQGIQEGEPLSLLMVV